jgi:hypothetical protein
VHATRMAKADMDEAIARETALAASALRAATKAANILRTAAGRAAARELGKNRSSAASRGFNCVVHAADRVAATAVTPLYTSVANCNVERSGCGDTVGNGDDGIGVREAAPRLSALRARPQLRVQPRGAASRCSGIGDASACGVAVNDDAPRLRGQLLVRRLLSRRDPTGACVAIFTAELPVTSQAAHRALNCASAASPSQTGGVMLAPLAARTPPGVQPVPGSSTASIASLASSARAASFASAAVCAEPLLIAQRDALSRGGS